MNSASMESTSPSSSRSPDARLGRLLSRSASYWSTASASRLLTTLFRSTSPRIFGGVGVDVRVAVRVADGGGVLVAVRVAVAVAVAVGVQVATGKPHGVAVAVGVFVG